VEDQKMSEKDPLWEYIEQHPFTPRFKFNNVGDDADTAADKSTPEQRERIIKESKTIDIDLNKRLIVRAREGGEGSGNFDHAGRPGERGGSMPVNDDQYKLQMFNYTTGKYERTPHTFAGYMDAQAFLGEHPEYDRPPYRVVRRSDREKGKPDDIRHSYYD